MSHASPTSPASPESTSSDQSVGGTEINYAATLRETASALRESCGPDPDSLAFDDRQRREQAEIIRLVETGILRSVTDDELEKWPVLSNKTSEHLVRLPLNGKRVIKVTWPGFYGQIPTYEAGRLDRRYALPSEYLERQAFQNEVFASDLHLEGINISDRVSMVIGQPSGQPSFVVTQGFVEAADPANSVPTEAQIKTFLEKCGFESIRGSYYGWLRKEDLVAIVDAKPDNFILSPEGVVPIDLQLLRLPYEIPVGEQNPQPQGPVIIGLEENVSPGGIILPTKKLLK